MLFFSVAGYFFFSLIFFFILLLILQKESRQTDNVDTIKRDNFIARATAESER